MSVNSRPGPLVRREPRAKPIVSTPGSRIVSTSARTAGDFAVAGELAAQATVDEDRQLPFLAQVRLPQLVARDAR
jgi:hypothetical protein